MTVRRVTNRPLICADRSAIFYHSEEQKQTAEKVTAEVQEKHYKGKPIVTQLIPAGKFYTAEEYHQKYLDKNPGGYEVIINGDAQVDDCMTMLDVQSLRNGNIIMDWFLLSLSVSFSVPLTFCAGKAAPQFWTVVTVNSEIALWKKIFFLSIKKTAKWANPMFLYHQ